MKLAGRVILILSLCCLIFSGALAQGFLNKPDPGYANRWNLGISLGPDFYYGDLTSGSARGNRNLSMAGSLLIGWQISNVFGTRLHFTGAWLNGAVDSLINGELVENPLTGMLLGGSLDAVINFSNIFSPYRSSRWFFLYGTVGLGYAGWYTEFSNQAYDAGTINTNNPLNNFHAALMVPVGIGVQLRLADRMNASVEYTFHLMMSDLLDQTVANSNNDRFDYLAIGFSLNLGKGKQKPPPVYYQPPPSRPTPRIMDPMPPATREPVPETPRVQEPVKPPAVTPQPLSYSVQICAFAEHTYTTDWIKKRYKIPMEVRIERSGKMERFLVGSCPDLACAKQLRSQMVKLGIRDAFIVVYQRGVRHHIVKE
ncbi:MAG: hypothetical protein IH596_13770 [Bacteroidales bacterium]|nr:hypothetical protein [Bacteroidales bacterium]